MRIAVLLFVYAGFQSMLAYAQQWIPSVSGIINSYTKVVAIDTCPARAFVDDATEFSTGKLVLLVQMNGATINQTNTPQFGSVADYRSAGLYEYGRISWVSGNEVYFTKKLVNTYEPDIAAVQLVLVPEYQDVTVSGTLRCKSWDGETGGILAIVVSNTLHMQAPIVAKGAGYRGGISYSVNWVCNRKDFYYNSPDRFGAMKGEGIGFVDNNKLFGRGAPANAGGGGNSTNTGGGGGALGGTGGLGGYQWGTNTNTNSCHYRDPNPDETPGVGGRSLAAMVPERIFIGGGGGAGDANDNVPSDGGEGGGIIMIQAGTIRGNNHFISADGDPGKDPPGLANEGGGGGGGGGLVWINAATIEDIALVSAAGGRGANVRNHGGNHGPGGGGGGGIILLAAAHQGSMNLNFTSGVAGIMTNNPGDPNWGARPGTQGLVKDAIEWVFQYVDDPDCIKIEECPTPILPNAFTPNGDPLNETFGLLNANETNLSNAILRIYNRWGNLVFETSDLLESWDGKFKDTAQPVGVYTWVIMGTCNEKAVLESGNVTLLR